MKKLMDSRCVMASLIALALGGMSSTSHAGGVGSTIGGGVGNTANGDYSTVSGGYNNSADGNAAVVAGGYQNTALGGDAVVAGGSSNFAGGAGSFAAGYQAHVRGPAETPGHPYGDQHTFVWNDGVGRPAPGYFSSTGTNQFLISATGGFGLNQPPINENVAMTIAAPVGNPLYANVMLRGFYAPDGILISAGNASAGANNASFYIDQYNGSAQTHRLTLDGAGSLTVTNQAYKPGGGSWAVSSDARLKTKVQPLSHALDQMLALKGVKFEYAHPDDGMHPSGTFSGFIAQDVEKVFPSWIGHDNDGYLTVGPQGFEALTVEALRELKTTENERVAALERDNSELRDLVSNQAKVLADLRREVAAINDATEMKSRQLASVATGKTQ
jgi:hypothetical protein